MADASKASSQKKKIKHEPANAHRLVERSVSEMSTKPTSTSPTNTTSSRKSKLFKKPSFSKPKGMRRGERGERTDQGVSMALEDKINKEKKKKASSLPRDLKVSQKDKKDKSKLAKLLLSLKF